MIYQYNDEYYIKMARKFVKVTAKLDAKGEVDFKPTKSEIELSSIKNISDYKEISLQNVKKNLNKKTSIKEETPKKYTKLNKII